jgi:hypothetical protein
MTCCSNCNDTGHVADPRSADEDGVADLIPCRRCGAYDYWHATPPADDEAAP